MHTMYVTIPYIDFEFDPITWQGYSHMNAEENSTPGSVWYVSSQHVAWSSSHRWAGIFFYVQLI